MAKTKSRVINWNLRFVDEAFQREHDSNWVGSYERVHESDAPADANVASSHVVRKVNTDEEGRRKMKAHLFPNGKEEDDKDSIRKDSSNAQLGITRLMLSLVKFFRLFTEGCRYQGRIPSE